ncbi:MAG: leucine-rich repeat domain-containing protein, partial [Clostridia bacterium]|nr:leucine-rich repeat domain-containing protein [Clostridia bacterium]
FALKDTFDKNYELVITDGEFTVTEVMVNITAQYLNEYNEILDEDGNKLEFDNGGLTLLFGREYTLSIVLPASHNRSNYTLQCSGTDVPKADIVNNQYTFRVINDSNFFVINVTENKYFIKCYDDDKTTVITTLRDRGHGTSLENNTEFGLAEVGIQSYIDYKSYRDKKYNYTFVEWRNISDDTRADFTNLTDDHYVYAYYTTTYDEYNVTNIPSQVRVFSGSASVNTTTKFHYEDVITIIYSVTEGYEMTEFSVTGAERVGTTKDYVVKGNVTITYTEEIITYSVANVSENNVGYALTLDGGNTIPEIVDYGTELVFRVNLDEAYSNSNVKVYVSSTESGIVNNANLLERASNGTYVVDVTDDVYIYIDGVVKNTYDVVIYENGTTNNIYETTVEHGDNIDYTPVKNSDNTYTYTFNKYVNRQGTTITLSNIVSDTEAYAVFDRAYIEYTLDCNSTNVTIAKGSTGLTTSDTLHYGDEITIVYNDSAYNELEDMTITGAEATSAPNTYVVTGNVTITVVETDLAEGVSNYSHLSFGSNGLVTPASGSITGDVVIPGVVRLADGSIYTVTQVGGFEENTAITSVTIPSTVTTIKNNAFNGCTALTRVTIADNSELITIGSQAFYGCSNLATITFGNNSKLTTLGDFAFYNCKKLTGVTLPSIVTTVGANALRYTKALTTLTINGTLSNFDLYSFANMSSLTSVVIEASYTKDNLPQNLFYGCSGLTSVLIKEGTNITKLPASMLEDCNNLESFVVEGENNIASIGDGFIMITGNNGSKLARFDLGTNRSLKSIGSGLFVAYKGNELTDANLNLGTLESLEYVGEKAFWGCSKITTLDFSKSKLTAFEKDPFYNCKALTTVLLPDTLVEIGAKLFSGLYYLTNVNIPSSVTTIGSSAFNGCVNIENTITITKDMVVASNAFDESGFRFEVSSDNTTYKAVGGALYSYDMTTLYRMAPKYMGEIFTIPEGVTTIADYALSDYTRFVLAVDQGGDVPTLSVRTIELPSTLVTIGEGAFYYLTTLENITVPSVCNISSIGDYAFAGCTSLTSFVIPRGVTTINGATFAYTGLTEITIHSGITEIDIRVFEGCESLTRIIVEEGCIITEITEDMIGDEDVYANIEIVYNNQPSE